MRIWWRVHELCTWWRQTSDGDSLLSIVMISTKAAKSILYYFGCIIRMSNRITSFVLLPATIYETALSPRQSVLSTPLSMHFFVFLEVVVFFNPITHHPSQLTAHSPSPSHHPKSRAVPYIKGHLPSVLREQRNPKRSEHRTPHQPKPQNSTQTCTKPKPLLRQHL